MRIAAFAPVRGFAALDPNLAEDGDCWGGPKGRAPLGVVSRQWFSDRSDRSDRDRNRNTDRRNGRCDSAWNPRGKMFTSTSIAKGFWPSGQNSDPGVWGEGIVCAFDPCEVLVAVEDFQD
jgi:hypothetical protein